MLRKWHIRRTTLLTTGCAAFLAGLGLARLPITIPITVLLCCLTIGIGCLIKSRPRAIIGALLIGLTMGWWRGTTFKQQLAPVVALNGAHVNTTMQAESDAVYDARHALAFDASLKGLPGRVEVSGFGEPAVFKGDKVSVMGTARATRGSHQLRISFAQIKVVGHNNSPIDELRRRFTAGMESALPEPLASFAMGLLIGQRNTLPAEISGWLAAVGLTHIIAVSGYNLTIIMDASRRLLQRGSKFQITVAAVALTIVFLLMTGLSASIVRAALVGLMSLAAWYYGRTFKPLLLILIAAAITSAWNPLYVWSDIGWYLSFLAFFGVLIIAPVLNQRLYGTAQPKAILALLTESLSALLATLPFMLYIFHQLSLIALIANVLIVPLVPLAMLLALIAGIAGMVSTTLGGWFALPARLLLTYMLDIVQLLSRIPHIIVQRQLTVSGMIVLYSSLLVIIITLWSKQRKNATITEINRSES